MEALSSTKVREALQRVAAHGARWEEAVAEVESACGSRFFALAQRLGVYGLTEPVTQPSRHSTRGALAVALDPVLESL